MLFVYIWPSVIDIKLVAIYSVTSQLMVSIIGNAVIDPLPHIHLILAALSNNAAWTLKTSAG